MTTSIASQSLMTSENENKVHEFIKKTIEAQLLTSTSADPQQIYLMAREATYSAYQKHWNCTREQCDPATIVSASLIATHSHLAQRTSDDLGLLYTFGYSMPDASILIETLIALGVVIYDIRYSPRSRSHKWRKPYLKHVFGDSYMHLPALGNIHYNTSLPIELADTTTGIPQVALPLLAGKHIALMCVCKEHSACHRRNAAEEIMKQVPNMTLVPLP